MPSIDGTSACCTFNRRGTLLAIGCREGILIFGILRHEVSQKH